MFGSYFRRAVRRHPVSIKPIVVSKPLLSHTVARSQASYAHEAIHHDNKFPSVRPIEHSGSSARAEVLQNQLRINTTHSAYYEAVARILKIRERYIRDRSVFVRGDEMLPILLGLGASQEDIQRLPSINDALVSDPSLPFRTTANSRFCFDWDNKDMRRLENQPFMLSHDEDFDRFDSGRVRNFDEIQADIGLNSAFVAVLIFKAMMTNGVNVVERVNLDYDVNKWVCIAFSVRTHTTPELLGEPALEGIHSDGADHTLVTFLGSRNMAPYSAATFVHSMVERTGIPLAEAFPLNILGHHTHSSFLDTLMILDHERKHSLTPVYAEDKAAPAIRDVLIFFTRRPYLDTHPASHLDSLQSHATLGIQVPLLDTS